LHKTRIDHLQQEFCYSSGNLAICCTLGACVQFISVLEKQ